MTNLAVKQTLFYIASVSCRPDVIACQPDVISRKMILLGTAHVHEIELRGGVNTQFVCLLFCVKKSELISFSQFLVVHIGSALVLGAKTRAMKRWVLGYLMTGGLMLGGRWCLIFDF